MKEQAPSLLEVVEYNPPAYFRYGKNINNVLNLLGRKRNWRTKAYIFYENSGAGKSLSAKLLAQEMGYKREEIYWQDRSDWWQNYTGQPFVIINEYTGQFGFEFFKDLIDLDPIQVQNKGGYSNFLARVVVFTSNKHPYSWYDLNGDENNQFNRRIDNITRFTELQQKEDSWKVIRTTEHGADIGLPTEGQGFFWDQLITE